MSCPSSLKSAGEIFSTEEEIIRLPTEYYVYTALMITLVLGTPLLYRQIWVAVWGNVSYYRRPKELRDGPFGCRQFGKLGHRNLSTEHNAGKRSNGHIRKNRHGEVEALFIHPIKSCYPVELDSSRITETGLEFDRQFCLAFWHEPSADQKARAEKNLQKGSSAYWDARPHWEFVTQRQNPSLTHLKIQIWRPDPGLPDYDEESEVAKSEGALIVSFNFSPPLTSISNIWTTLTAKIKALSPSAIPIGTFSVPLAPSAEQIKSNNYGQDIVRVWRDEVRGIDMTQEIPKDVLKNLQLFLLDDIRRQSPSKYSRIRKSPPELCLFRIDSSTRRNVHKCAPTKDQLGYQAHTDFQDSYPIHLQNMASITDAELQIPEGKAFTPDSRRFRANIHVSGPPAYDEDDWTAISINGHKFHVSCRTTRCKLPTNSPDTGMLGADVQPYNHLQKNRAIDEGAPQSGCLGMMLVPSHDAVGTTINVGDELAILKSGKHFFIADAEPEAQRPVI